MFLRILDRLEEIIIATLIAAATLLIFVAVVQRYLVGVPFLYPYFYHFNLTWAQELCIYMFVWMAKFGAAYGVRTGIHVGVDVMINRLPPATRKAYVLFGLFAGASFTGIVGTLGTTFVWDIAHAHSTSPDLELTTGRFFDRRHEARPHDQAYDREARQRLWDLSVKLTGA